MKSIQHRTHAAYVHAAEVASARKGLHDEKTTLDLSDTFKVLSDPTRLKIVLALMRAELCVCDIAALLGMSDSAISHQLRVLKNLRLVKHRRKGKQAYYALDDGHIEEMISVAARHVQER